MILTIEPCVISEEIFLRSSAIANGIVRINWSYAAIGTIPGSLFVVTSILRYVNNLYILRQDILQNEKLDQDEHRLRQDCESDNPNQR